MSVVWIRAMISCDECGRHFSVHLPVDHKTPAGWCLWDVAEDAVRGGLTVESGFAGGATSVQGDKMLCHGCTASEDGKSTP